MISLVDLARSHTTLDHDQIEHLFRLTTSWDLLADLCFGDLLLFAPATHGADDRAFVILGHIRPTTSQTLYRADEVGRVVSASERPLVARTFELDQLIDGEAEVGVVGERVRVQCIPIRHEDELVAVLTREAMPTLGRRPGELERAYTDVFNRFARMMAAGEFPFREQDSESGEAIRVVDGALILDNRGRTEYVSPNAVSALHRLGFYAATEGRRVSELGLDEEIVRQSLARRIPVTAEVDDGLGVVVVVRCVPLIDKGEVTGALVLIRDVSELRRRDRLLLSKDATLREVHHRVKNNLQTISSLLRLQSRRVDDPEIRAALDDSVRRVESIAQVHEILSREPTEDLPFVEVLRPLLRTVEEGLVAKEQRVQFRIEGDPGVLPAAVATPMALVLTELLQNVVEHAYPLGDGRSASGKVIVRIRNDGRTLWVRVIDDGEGLPPGFSIEEAGGLGLSIVRTLVTADLNGRIRMRPSEDGEGTMVELEVPLLGRVRDESPG